MKLPAKTYLAATALQVSILVISLIASMAAARWVINHHGPQSHHGHGHEWIHEDLDIEDGDFPELEVFEAVYVKNRAALLRDMQALQAELSDLLMQKSAIDEEVVSTIHKIHVVHGKLQELSIQHYFDMLSILPEAKQQRLRKLAAESLSQPP